MDLSPSALFKTDSLMFFLFAVWEEKIRIWKIKIICYVEIGCKIPTSFCTWQIRDHCGISKCVTNIYKGIVVTEKGTLHPLLWTCRGQPWNKYLLFQSSNIPFHTKWCKPVLNIMENILLLNCVSSLIPKYKTNKQKKTYNVKITVTKNNEYNCSVCGPVSVISDSH